MRKPSYTKSHQIGLLHDTYSPKTLMQLFSDEIKPKQPKKKTPARSARRKGNNAEALLIKHLELSGYEARRTHLSAFPDVIAWNDDDFLLIEVKARIPSGVSNALSLFRANVKTLTSVPKKGSLLCYVRVNGAWNAHKWCGSGTQQVASVIVGER